MSDERLREAQRQVVVRWFHWIMNQDDIDQDPNAQADKLLDGLVALAATPAPGFEAAQVPGSTDERLREANKILLEAIETIAHGEWVLNSSAQYVAQDALAELALASPNV